MDKIKLSKSELFGEVSVCSSKSVSHRAIILSALSGKKMKISGVDLSDDITATIEALKSLGIQIEYQDKTVCVDASFIKRNSSVKVNAGESGSTLRFFIPLVIALNNEAEFNGEGRLPKRPLDDYFELFKKEGIFYERKEDYLPLLVKNTFKSSTFEIKGNTSSQFVTGLMLASLCYEREITIKITTNLESKPYIDITADVMRDFGHIVEFSGNEIRIKKGKTEISEYTVENDWSQAAFFLVGGLISGEVKLKGMNLLSSQGDKKILDVLKSFGGNITTKDDAVIAKKSKLLATDIDASDIPDLVPILSVAAAMAEGTTLIYNAGRLRIKESDRLLAVTEMLGIFGIPVEMGEDYLKITGKGIFKGGKINSFNDHRIVMSASIAALNCDSPLIIEDYKAVNKSYPEFFEDYIKLGGKGDIVK